MVRGRFGIHAGWVCRDCDVGRGCYFAWLMVVVSRWVHGGCFEDLLGGGLLVGWGGVGRFGMRGREWGCLGALVGCLGGRDSLV